MRRGHHDAENLTPGAVRLFVAAAIRLDRRERSEQMQLQRIAMLADQKEFKRALKSLAEGDEELSRRVDSADFETGIGVDALRNYLGSKP